MKRDSYRHSKSYYCRVCNRRHNTGSIIGERHLEFKKLGEMTRLEMIRYKRRRLK